MYWLCAMMSERVGGIPFWKSPEETALNNYVDVQIEKQAHISEKFKACLDFCFFFFYHK